jgi:CheY-like chemotaxis protein
MAYGVISQHNGLIEVNSKPGRTAFTISLPLLSATAAMDAGRGKDKISPGGNETILLVEDDLAVRNATCAILKYGGYNVICSENGREAVEIFRKPAAGIDLVLMDVIMPVMNGKEAYLQIRSLCPDVRILFTSGYTADILEKEGVNQMLVLEKPVSPNMLLMVVREALDAQPDSEEVVA